MRRCKAEFSKGQKRKGLFIQTSLMLMLLGFEAAGLQISLLSIADEFHLNGTLMGMIVAVQFLAIFMMPILSGKIGDLIGKKKVVAFGAVSFVAGAIIILYSFLWETVFLGIFFIGTGYSICESMMTAALFDYYKEEGSRFASWSQCFFNLGSVISPVYCSYLMKETLLGWRSLFLFLAVSYTILLCTLTRVEFAKAAIVQIRRKKEKMQRNHFVLLYLCMLLIFLYLGLENGTGYFLDSFLSLEMKEVASSAWLLSFFWLMMIPSRLLYGLLNSDFKKLMLPIFISSAVLLFLFSINKSIWANYFIIGCLGFLYGPVWPGLMSMSNEAYPQETGRVSGMMTASCGIGGAVFPVLMGILMDYFGIRQSFLLISMIAVAGMIVSLRIIQHIKCLNK